MTSKKHITSKKRNEIATPNDIDEETSKSFLDDDLNIDKDKKSIRSKSPIYERYDDDVSPYEEENIDTLDTIEGVEYEPDTFRKQYPHLAEEVGDPELNYPIDAVRWEEEEETEQRDIPSEELNLESLLRRSKSDKEALEIIKYLEKQGEISRYEAEKYITIVQNEGIDAFKKKKRK